MSIDKDLGTHYIDPSKIKFADDDISSDKPFRNARTHLNTEEIANKRESIRTLGVLKPPIVRPLANDPDGYLYQMVAGSLRLRCILKLIDDNANCYNAEKSEWMAAKELYKTLKCSVRDCDEETAIRISIAENLEHSQVPELDLMEYCQELVELKESGKPKYTRTQVANLCNRHESWVSITLQLNKLPPAYKKLMYEGRLSRTGATAMMLGTSGENFDRVIEACKEEVRKEAIEEETNAIKEENSALSDLEDAEIDMGIHEMKKDQEALENAKKRVGSAKKRVSVASDKRKNAQNKKETGVITAETVNKIITKGGVRKGKVKPLTPKSIKELHESFVSYASENKTANKLSMAVAIAVLELTLGKRPHVENLGDLIEQELQKLEFTTITPEAMRTE